MKKLYILFTAIVFTCFGAQAQLGVDTFELGEDNANNYPGASWTTTNEGTGFSDWTFDTGGSGFKGRFIGSFSAALDVSGNSFGLFANSDPSAFSGAATKMPKTLEEGDSFTVSVGVNFRDGNKGFDLGDSSNNTIINFNVASDTYNITGTGGLFSNTYDANTVFTFTFTQNASDVSWTAVRSGGLSGTQSGTIGSISPGTINNIRFFNTSAGFNNDGGSGQRNLYINSLEFESTYTIAGNSTVSSSGDTTVPYLDVQSGSTLNIPSNSNVTVSGDLDNSGSINLTSTSTQYPSLIVNGSSTGNVTYNRYINSNANGNDLIAPPVDGQTWADFLTDNATPLLDNGGSPTTIYAFAPFDKTTGGYENYNSGTSATLNTGTGYRAATSSGETLDFTGTVETGTVSVDIENSGPEFEKWNLIGNPYSSYLNVQDFLNHEVSAGVTNLDLFESGTGAIYGYDGDASDGWTIYNLANTSASTVIAPGQGFFVSADATNAGLHDLEFTAAMRTSGSSDDFVSGRQGGLIYFVLNATAGSDSYNTSVYFNSFASLTFDFGFDAEYFGELPFILYTEVVEITSANDPTNLELQTISTDDLANTTIPLGVNASQGVQLTFSLTTNTLPATTELFLDDTIENTTTLLNNSDYVVTPNVDLNGTGRFFLRVFDATLSTPENNTLESLSIFALNNSNEIIVKGQLQENTNLSLFDVQGRNVLSTHLDHTSLDNRINTSGLSAGIYIVNIKNNEQSKSQKVILK